MPYRTERPPLVISEPRLRHLLVRDPLRCATVSEYSASTGMDTADVISALDPLLSAGVLGLEAVAGELFVHTAPHGRPVPTDRAEVPANLWELFRLGTAQEAAAGLWRLSRQLVSVGWRVEVQPDAIQHGMGRVAPPPKIGVCVGHLIVPVVAYPDVSDVAAPGGLLSRYTYAGARAVALTCAAGRLDLLVTAARQFFIERGATASLAVLVLEAPRFAPTLLTVTDQALDARTVTRAVLANTLDQ